MTGRGKRELGRKTTIFSLIAFSSTSRVKRAPSSSKLEFWTPWVSKRGPVRAIWEAIWVPRDCLFPLPVEEKAISGFSGNARDGLFPLPVEEKVISGAPQEDQERSFSDDSGCQLRPLAIAFSSCLSRKRLSESSLGMLAIAFSPCLSRKSTFQGSPGKPKSDPFQMVLDASQLSPLATPPAVQSKIRAAQGSSGMLCSPSSHGLDILCSPSSHVMCTCDGTNVIKVH